MRLDIHVVGRGDPSTNYGLDRRPKIKNVKYQFYHKHVKMLLISIAILE